MHTTTAPSAKAAGDKSGGATRCSSTARATSRRKPLGAKVHSPHRRTYLGNATGTHPLGNTEFAQAIWQAAASPPQRPATKPTLKLLR